MLCNSRTLEENIINCLKNNSQLAETIKSFSVGNMNVSRKIFPFIELGNFTYRQGLLRAASGALTYHFDIYVGTSSLIPGVAYKGLFGKKTGVAELCNMVVQAMQTKEFQKLFITSVNNISVNPGHWTNRSGTQCVGKISYTGDVWYQL